MTNASPEQAADEGSRITVIVADDDEAMVDALSAVIESRPFLKLVGVGYDAEEAVSAARRLRPRVALLDVLMPGGGPQAARSIREASPGTSCVAISAYINQEWVSSMRAAGALEYLVKGAASADDIVNAIRHAAGRHGGAAGASDG